MQSFQRRQKSVLVPFRISPAQNQRRKLLPIARPSAGAEIYVLLHVAAS